MLHFTSNVVLCVACCYVSFCSFHLLNVRMIFSFRLLSGFLFGKSCSFLVIHNVLFRDVIRSPDIQTFESRSEVRTPFQHPEVRIYINVQKCTSSFRKYFRIITQRSNMTFSRISDFAYENTTIGDNCGGCAFI